MKRLPLLLLSGLAVAAMAACGGKKPETTPVPVANTDAEEAERARIADSIARADREAKEREEAERDRQRRIADSLAAIGKPTEAVRALLALVIPFHYATTLIRPGGAAGLDQNVALVQWNP